MQRPQREHARAAEERERRAAEAEERAQREGRAAGFHDEQAAERERPGGFGMPAADVRDGGRGGHNRAWCLDPRPT
jgi:hypothetical protein